MKKRIHILGATGSGTTTLAKKLCNRLGYTHMDTDDFFWESTNPPYTKIRPVPERQQLILKKINKNDNWILSGSLCGWGDIFIPHFELVIFMYLPKDIRMERLKKREYERYGEEMKEGGAIYEHSQAFLEWASTYDTETEFGRNLVIHEKWLNKITCPIIRINNKSSIENSIDCALQSICI